MIMWEGYATTSKGGCLLGTFIANHMNAPGVAFRRAAVIRDNPEEAVQRVTVWPSGSPCRKFKSSDTVGQSRRSCSKSYCLAIWKSLP